MTAKPFFAMLAFAAFSARANLDRAGNILADDDGGGSGKVPPEMWMFLIGLPMLTFVVFQWLKSSKPAWSHALSFNVAFFGSSAALLMLALA